MNLREFSKKIGLPVSTISKALGGYKDVNDKTRAKIVLLAQKYKYAPNVYAKNLASRTSLSVGLVLPLGYNFIQKNALIDFIQNIYSKLNNENIPVIIIFAENSEDDYAETLLSFYLQANPKIVKEQDEWAQSNIGSEHYDSILIY